MTKRIIISSLIVISLITLTSCNKEEPFVCTSNTKALFNGESEYCGTAEVRHHQASTQVYDEEFRFYIDYGIIGNNTIQILPGGEIKEGDSYVATGETDSPISISATQPGAANTYINNINSNLKILKLDRTLNLISFSFEVTGVYNNDINVPYSLSATITDLPFE